MSIVLKKARTEVLKKRLTSETCAQFICKVENKVDLVIKFPN